MKYRAEIDGLRAISVLPVILFHAGFKIFSGGFVGVDVFFVISGYLITTILIDDIENKRFSIVKFYERRARRILPALFFVMLVCVPLAWFSMVPTQMEDFSQSVIAVSLFVSNIFFANKSGYFDMAAEEKPLLHTWSLAVEEQYYVLFPLFLILTWRFGRNKVLWLICFMAVASLILSEWSWRKYPIANFYSTPTRAWELFIGSIAAFVIKKQGIEKSNFLSTAGLAAIMFSVFFYDEYTPTPSIYILVPVIGAFLILLYGNKETVVAKILSNKFFVGVGLISYSAYLWHQPLFAFARINSISHPSNSVMLFLVICSLALAFISWKLIERPFRSKTLIGFRSIFLYSSIFIAMFCIIGVFGNSYTATYHKTLVSTEFKYSNKRQKLSALDAFNYLGLTKDSEFSNARIVFPPTSAKTSFRILILGDSHAGHLQSGFAELVAGELNAEVHLLSFVGCPPLFGSYKVYDIRQKAESIKQKECRDTTAFWESYLRLNADKYGLVILSARWNWLVNPSRSDGLFIREDSILERNKPFNPTRILSLDERIDNLSVAIKRTYSFIDELGIPSAILSQPPVQMADVRKLKSFKDYDEVRPKFSDAFERHQRFETALTKSGFGSSPMHIYVNTFPIFCSNGEKYCVNRKGNDSLYRDSDHLNPFGSYSVGLLFLERLRLALPDW